MPFAATRMYLQIVVLSEVRQKEIDKCNVHHVYMESKIRDGRGYLQNRNRLTDTENRLVVANGKGLGKIWIGSLGQQRQTIINRMDREQCPTA